MICSKEGLPKVSGMSSSSAISRIDIDLSARVRVILVGFGSPHPSFFIIEMGIKFILAPKSHKALPMSTGPMEQGIVKAPGSFSLGGSFF